VDAYGGGGETGDVVDVEGRGGSGGRSEFRGGTTGTAVGDLVEMEAIAEVYSEGRTEPLVVSSAKTNTRKASLESLD